MARKIKTVKSKPPRWWREEGSEDDVRARGLLLEARVQLLQGKLKELQLRVGSYRGEIRSLLFDRPRVLGKTADEIIEELLEEQHQRRCRAVAGQVRSHRKKEKG
jgi:hypothetical protein